MRLLKQRKNISAVDEAMREKVINRLKEKVEVGINKEKK